MAFARYKGQLEEDPGKMKFRLKGMFASKIRARELQQKLSKEGKRSKVVHFPGETHPWSVYVVAPHEFWKKNFIIDGRK